MTAAVRKAPREQRLALIKGHPDLAGKAARAGTLTADSTAEQASAGLDRLSEQEFADFHRLNDAYRQKFGIPFIVCVRRHTKDSILRQFKRAWTTTRKPRKTRHCTKSSASPRCASTSASTRRTGSRCTAGSRPTSSTPATEFPARGVTIELLELSDNGDRRMIATRRRPMPTAAPTRR